LLVGDAGISPSDFWRMQPYEFWWFIEAKKQGSEKRVEAAKQAAPVKAQAFDFNYHYSQLS